MNLHPDCEPLAFLVGTWNGSGAGHYPTIEDFAYTEEVSFAHVGKPFLAYSQKTRDATTGQPLHAETGYLRSLGAGRIEFVVAQPSGIVEIHQGEVDGRVLRLELVVVQVSPAAKSVTDVKREMSVYENTGGAVLQYDLSMAAVGEPLTHHLHAELVRQPLHR